MQKLKDILRLRYQADLTHRQIAASLSLSKGSVAKFLKRAQEAGLTWPLPDGLTDAALAAKLQPPRKSPDHPLAPTELDFEEIRKELSQSKMTLQLLWEEYAEANPKNFYSYSRYCVLYKKWTGRQKLSMRQTHKAGEKLFVDYCGPTMSVVNPDTGETRQAQVFVAVMGVSSYTFAEATWTQSLPDWIGSHVRCFEFLGGLPTAIVPDNLKSAVSKACRYEPDLNPTYHQMSLHYDVAVIPARPYKPKDKAKAEVGVQIVERWIMMRLRKQTFHTLAALNQAILELLKDLNNRPFKQRPGSRQSQFDSIDKPALKILPARPFEHHEVKKARVHMDYHVEYDGHYYSVPYQLVKEEVMLYISNNSVKVLHNNQQVALHPRAYSKGHHTTDPKHMAESHRKHQEWSPSRFLRWAEKIGPQTRQVVNHQLTHRPHPEHGYRACLGLLNLIKKYDEQRLEAACKRAIAINAPNYKSIVSILQKGLDRVPLEEPAEQESLPLEHDNVRGADYFH